MKYVLPRYSLKRVVLSKLFHTLLGNGSKNPFFNVLNFFDPQNIENYSRYANREIECNVCGKTSRMLYDFPNVKHRSEHRIGLIRETLQCRQCGATMRDRTLAHALLVTLNSQKLVQALSIANLGQRTSLNQRILDTDAFSTTSRLLAQHSNYVRSSFISSIKFGTELEPNWYNINLERIDLPSASFDVILTSDVAEHIRDIESAHREIHRILRPGGKYIFTIPYDPDCKEHHILVDTSTSEDRLLVPAQFHGDPLSGGILAYRVFGRKIFEDLEQIGFSVEFMSVDDVNTGIFGGDVFVATR